ncbi:hypothetical protein B0H14DRAFT_1606977 [Mycena olivaceomarginata]|nr:hypothetical protein B0H14DRAFT_1606977 [Mycena olivaceomarginata]
MLPIMEPLPPMSSQPNTRFWNSAFLGSTMNTIGSVVFFFWIPTPIIYFENIFFITRGRQIHACMVGQALLRALRSVYRLVRVPLGTDLPVLARGESTAACFVPSAASSFVSDPTHTFICPRAARGMMHCAGSLRRVTMRGEEQPQRSYVPNGINFFWISRSRGPT